MQTQVHALAEHSRQNNQSVQQPAQLSAEQSDVAFEDARPKAAQLKSMQAMMGSSQHNQNMHNVQANMNGGARIQEQRAQQVCINQAAQLNILEPVQRLPILQRYVTGEDGSKTSEHGRVKWRARQDLLAAPELIRTANLQLDASGGHGGMVNLGMGDRVDTLRAIGKSFAELSIDRQGSAKALNLRKKAYRPAQRVLL